MAKRFEKIARNAKAAPLQHRAALQARAGNANGADIHLLRDVWARDVLMDIEELLVKQPRPDASGMTGEDKEQVQRMTFDARIRPNSSVDGMLAYHPSEAQEVAKVRSFPSFSTS
eukprot:scaffold2963_cov250-Pinguiococcus_pyrenoidosus.AAC.34